MTALIAATAYGAYLMVGAIVMRYAMADEGPGGPDEILWVGVCMLIWAMVIPVVFFGLIWILGRVVYVGRRT